jgi:UDP-N-acetyl-D-glucosamine dehydrogenase
VSTSIDTLERRIDTRAANVAVVGMGYVGLSLAVELARAGFRVHGIDLDVERVSLLNRGASYLVDVTAETLAPLVRKGRLTATTTFEVAAASDVLIVCVPTPLRKSKEPDIPVIPPALESPLPHLRQGQLRSSRAQPSRDH